MVLIVQNYGICFYQRLYKAKVQMSKDKNKVFCTPINYTESKYSLKYFRTCSLTGVSEMRAAVVITNNSLPTSSTYLCILQVLEISKGKLHDFLFVFPTFLLIQNIWNMIAPNILF